MQNKLLIRASSVGRLMTEPKEKAKKEVGELGDTAKALMREIWLFNEFGYSEDVYTKQMLKGHLCEQDSIGLVQEVLGGEFRMKNTQAFQNEYSSGHPDIVLKQEDYIEDTKTSYNLRTFLEAGIDKNYEWQGQDYMWLTGKKNFRLIYCLVPTPDEIILEEKKSFWYKFGCDETNQDYIDISMQIDHNNDIIRKIPPEKRIKVFEFEYSEEKTEKFLIQYEKAKRYYDTLELKSYEPKLQFAL